MTDAAGIVAVQAAQLDRAYIDRWAAALGVTPLWHQVRAASLDSTGG